MLFATVLLNYALRDLRSVLVTYGGEYISESDTYVGEYISELFTYRGEPRVHK